MELTIFAKVLTIIFIPTITGYIGYFFGSAKFFREQKQKAYIELLPPIIKMAYNREKSDESEYNKALLKLWLYGNAKVARKMDKAVSLINHPENGDITKTLQEAIVEMRTDIQLYCWQRLKASEVRHLYATITQG